MFPRVQSVDGDSIVQEQPKIYYKQMDGVTMTIHHVTQCCVGMDPDVPPELRSEGYAESGIKLERKSLGKHIDEDVDEDLYE